MHLAKKMIEDRSRDYMNARRVAKVSQVAALLTNLVLQEIARLCELIQAVVWCV